MGKLRTIILSALVAGLMLGNTGSVLAAEPPETNVNIFGEVVAIEQVIKGVDSNEAFIDLKTNEGNIRVKVTANTQYKNGSFTDIAVGKRLALVASEADGVLTAEQLLIIPSEPRYEHLVGTITSVSGTMVNASSKQDDSFTFEVQPDISLDKIEPGQLVTAVVSNDPGLTELMAVRVVSKDEKPEEAETEATSSAAATITEKTGPVEATPPAPVKEIWLDLPSEQIKEVWVDPAPEQLKEIWMELPPEQLKEIWMELPPEQLKQIWMNLPPELAKQIWMNLPPELAKQIWMNLPPELAKQIWMNLPPELAKQIWMNLPSN
jgi:hypothetical protein